MEEKKKLYVGCSLTHAPQEFKDQVEATKDELRKSWNVLEFLGLGPAEVGDVYRRDITENVGGCDAFVGIFDEPSSGLGFETGVASVHLLKPVLATAHIGSKVTRLITDAGAVLPNMSFRPYEDMVVDVPRLVAVEFAPVLNGQ